ncbi:MAG TPA: metalloregulator ArsR/SmtB family transcription factor [Candidatus Eisenbacteria bacterium]|nr:metalloregulator ArsR/SmtB family transcription factor [Candidatus Eisenbacteria bacterium]
MALIWKSKEVDEVQAAGLFHALAHPIRLRIVRMLMENESACQDIVDRLPVAQSTVSQHLKVLRQAGIVQDKAYGPRKHYAFREEALERVKKYLNPLR